MERIPSVSVKNTRTEACPVGDQQQRPTWFQREQHRDQEMLEEGCAAATQVAISFRCDDVCRPQLREPVWLWLPREHLVDCHQYLICVQFRPQVAEVLRRAGRLSTACRGHTLPVRP
jgi:hypothetical protein